MDAQTTEWMKEWKHCAFYPPPHLQAPRFLSQKIPFLQLTCHDSYGSYLLFYKWGLIHFGFSTYSALVFAGRHWFSFFPQESQSQLQGFCKSFSLPSFFCLNHVWPKALRLWRESGFPLRSYSSTEASTARSKNVIFTQTAGSSVSTLLPLTVKAGYRNILLEHFTQNQHFSKVLTYGRWPAGEISYLQGKTGPGNYC